MPDENPTRERDFGDMERDVVYNRNGITTPPDGIIGSLNGTQRQRRQA
jgi:hypothetical protein